MTPINTGSLLLLLVIVAVRCQYCNVAMNTDIVIAVHDSTSTMYRWWGGITISPGLINFLRTLVTIFNLSKVRISLIAYGSSVRLIVPFTSSSQSLQSSLQWSPEFGGGRTYDAVVFIRSYFRNNARPNTAKFVIFVTNRPSDNTMATVSQSIQMRNEEISIMGVAFGGYPLHELSLMAGANNVVYSATDELLPQNLGFVKLHICTMSEEYRKILSKRLLSDTVLVLDHSDSTRRISGLDYSWATSLPEFATRFTENLTASNGRCAAGVVTFSDTATVQQTLTANINHQSDIISSLAADNTILFSGSSITSGITSAANLLKNRGNPYSKKFMIVVVDGSPADDIAMETAAVAASDAGITVYAVSLRTATGLSVNQATLTSIARDVHRTVADRTDADLAEAANDLADSVCSNII